MADEKALRVTSGNTVFTKQLYEELAKTDGNVFFSPLSVHTILSLVSQGAAGDTVGVFNSALNVTHEDAREGYKNIMTDLNNVQDVALHIANKVFVKDSYKLKEAFKNIAVQNYLAEVQNVNFNDNVKAAGEINTWVEGKTNNKIHDLIKPTDLDALTRMVLVNAIYFKGDWMHKFDKANTIKKAFYTSATESKDVDMMYQKESFRYGDNTELDAQLLEMPYKNKDVSMFIILPKKRDGIKELEAKLKDFDMSKLREGMYSTDVKVWLPKFKIETTMELNEPLKKLGLRKIFEDPDFSNLLESKEDLVVSKVIQKAFIEVNEEGAEAAAATGGIMMMRCMPIPKPVMNFNAEHPFIALLVQRKNDIKVLFMGRIAELQ